MKDGEIKAALNREQENKQTFFANILKKIEWILFLLYSRKNQSAKLRIGITGLISFFPYPIINSLQTLILKKIEWIEGESHDVFEAVNP